MQRFLIFQHVVKCAVLKLSYCSRRERHSGTKFSTFNSSTERTRCQRR